MLFDFKTQFRRYFVSISPRPGWGDRYYLERVCGSIYKNLTEAARPGRLKCPDVDRPEDDSLPGHTIVQLFIDGYMDHGRNSLLP